ncbi:MAG TPA: hypothetical protein VM053_08785 [Gemmatimonadaceae bacterium]|nr:hypothetical protein [Gemmatimonadaceae bacterium]
MLFFVALAAFYGAIAFAWFVAPIVSRFSTTLVGTAQYAPDAMLNAGVLEWVYGSLRSSSLHVFDWTAAFPLENSLAVTENLIGWQVFYYPLRLLGLGIVSSYNVLLLLSFVISGLAAAALCMRLGTSRSGAVIGGFVFAFVPFHVTHSIHLQTMGVCWAPLAILFLDRILERGRWSDVAGLVAACVMTALSSIYFAVFLAIVVFLWVAGSWVFRRYGANLAVLGKLAAAGVASIVPLLPVLIHYVQFVSVNGRFSHPSALISVLSMELAGVVRVGRWQALWPTGPFEPDPNSAPAAAWTTGFPGVVAIALTAYWLVRVIQKKENRELAAVLVSVAVICFVFSLGPYLKVRGSAPSEAMHWLPMPGRIWLVFSTIRWPMRLYFFTVLMMSVMVSLGATSLLASVRSSRRMLVTVALAAMMILEYRPLSAFARLSVEAADPLAMSDAYPFLAAEADRGAIAELPLADHGGRRAPMVTRYTYGSVGHLRRVVAVHGSVIPPVTKTLETAMKDLPDRGAQMVLSNHGVTRLVIHRPLFKRDSAEKLIAALKGDGLAVVFNGTEAIIFSLTGPRQVH